MKLLFTILFFLSITSKIYAIDTKATEAIVYDYNSQEILFEKNADIKTYPASMTKILTTYIVFDRIKNTNLSLSDKCSVSPKAYRMGGSRMFLEVSSKVTINDLLKGIIVQSGNDASVTIAECLSGTEEDFALIMNEYAKKIGMKNTNFSNSSGWPDKKHYSTVKDLLLLSNKLILDFPKYYQYFKEKKFKYNNINQPNRNKLLVHVEGTDGLKTGYTKDSGYGIASSVIRDERRISVVINGSKTSRERLNESEKLLEEISTNYIPPEKPIFKLPGSSVRDKMYEILDKLYIEKKILNHGLEVGKQLAFVLSGGNTSIEKELSENDMYALELEVFMNLIQKPKTQERIKYTLETGKPLVN